MSTDSVDVVYEEFWKDIVEKDGVLDLDQVKKELFDFLVLMRFVPKVYMHITNGQISKPNTDPDVVINMSDDVLNQCVKDALEEMRSKHETRKG